MKPDNFGVFQCRRPRFGNVTYFDVFPSKMSLVFNSKFLWRHHYDVIIGSLRRLCNIGVSQCIKSKFSNMGYFELFSSKMLFVFKFKACMTS